MLHKSQDIKNADLDKWKNRVNQLNSHIRACEGEINIALTTLAEFESRLAELRNSLAPLIAQKELLVAHIVITNTQNEIEKIENEIAALFKQVELFQQQHAEIQDEIHSTEVKIQLYTRAQALKLKEAQLDSATQKISHQTKIIKDIDSKVIVSVQEKNEATMRSALAKQQLQKLQEITQSLIPAIKQDKKDFPEYRELKYKFKLNVELQSAKDRLTQLRIKENENKLRLKELLNESEAKKQAILKLYALKLKSKSLIEVAKKNGTMIQPEWNLDDIKTKINDIEDECAGIRQSIATVEKKIRCEETELQNLKDNLAECNENTFCAIYFNEPGILLQATYIRLNNIIENYRRDHQSLSDDELVCISQYLKKAYFIVKSDRREDESDNLISFQQLRVQQLYGLIYAHQQEYSARCGTLCNEFAIALGDQKLDEDEAKRKYFEVMLAHNDQLDHPANVEMERVSDYEDALAAFKSALQNQPEDASQLVQDYYKAGRNLLNTIQNAANGQADKSGYVSVLRSAKDLLQHPEDGDKHTALTDSTKLNIDGKRNIPQTVIGALLLFVGLAGVVACALTVQLSGGLSLLGVVGGLMLASAGLTMLGNAKPEGTKKAVTDFQSAVSKSARKSNLLTFRFHRTVEEQSLLNERTLAFSK